MSKIAIVMGRGVEGCGVTKYCVELEDWLIKNSHDTTVYASKDKKWSRNDSHTFHNLVHVHFGRDDFDEVYEGCKESDIIIFNSLPSVSHSKECIENFSKLFDLKTKKVSIQHDHNISSLRRNVLLQESYEKVDYIFAHSQTGDFAEMVNTPNLFDLDADTTIHLMQPAISFSNYKKYWKGIEEQDAHHHKWIGRTSRWKGYDLMIRFHDEYLKGAGHLTTLEGIERSPVFIEFKNQYDFYNEINSDVDEVDLLENNMQYLHKNSRYVLWLNPLKGSPGFQPTTRGMQAALPYIDFFASAHNIISLRNLVRQLTLIQSGQVSVQA